MKTLALVLSPDLAAPRWRCGSALMPLPAPRALAEEVGEALGGEGDGEEDEDEDRGGEAASRSARPTRSTAVAISQTRPSVVAATMPIAFWRLPAASSACARLAATTWIAALGEPGGGADGVAEQGQSAQQKDCESDGQQQ